MPLLRSSSRLARDEYALSAGPRRGTCGALRRRAEGRRCPPARGRTSDCHRLGRGRPAPTVGARDRRTPGAPYWSTRPSTGRCRDRQALVTQVRVGNPVRNRYSIPSTTTRLFRNFRPRSPSELGNSSEQLPLLVRQHLNRSTTSATPSLQHNTTDHWETHPSSPLGVGRAVLATPARTHLGSAPVQHCLMQHGAFEQADGLPRRLGIRHRVEPELPTASPTTS